MSLPEAGSKRRRVWATWAIACGLTLIAGLRVANAAEPWALEEPVDDARVFGVGLRLDVQGKVQTRGDDGKTVDLPLTATAAISYRERRLLGPGSGPEALRAAREYEQAQSDIKVAEEQTTIRLPDLLKLAVAQGRASGAEVYSLSGALSAQELDLLSPPTDSLGAIALLPPRAVTVGEEWTPNVWVAPYLARFEATSKSNLTCKLEAVSGSVARIVFQGDATGAVQGAPSEVSFKGTLDYNTQSKSISDFEFVQTEKRAVGAVSVGLDVTARLKFQRKPAQLPARMGDATVIDAAAQDPPPTALLLRFESPWGISLLHSRQWHLFKQTEQVAIFRLLDDGLFIAQCNLSPIPSAKPGEHTSEQVFLNDIRQSLMNKLETIVSNEVVPTSDRRHLRRVVVHGAIGERKLTWIYLLSADPTGKQASMMFALDRALAERLGTKDLELAQSLRFGASPATAILKATPPR